MLHGEPNDEYLSPQKAEYREAVWACFAEAVPDVATAKVLFFPGRHGLEVPVALRHGFQEGNLIACEENAAILATAKWRKEYPAVRCYGTTLSRTIDRLVTDKVRLDAANLDFCSNLCGAVLADIRKLVDSEIWADTRLLLAITLLKGREDTALVDIAKLSFASANGTADRIGIIKAFIASQLYVDCEVLLQGEYRSASKNMVYGALALNGLERVLRATFPAFHKSKDPQYAEILALLQEAGATDPLYLLDNPAWEHAEELLGAIKDEECALRDNVVRKFNLRTRDGRRNSNFRAVPILPSVLASECWGEYRALEIANMDACLKAARDERENWHQQWVQANTERAQLLQAGRAYS